MRRWKEDVNRDFTELEANVLDTWALIEGRYKQGFTEYDSDMC